MEFHDYESFLFFFLFCHGDTRCLKMLYSIHVYYMPSWASLPEYFPLGKRKPLECYVNLCLLHRVT
jgi:hypothetical protein